MVAQKIINRIIGDKKSKNRKRYTYIRAGERYNIYRDHVNQSFVYTGKGNNDLYKDNDEEVL